MLALASAVGVGALDVVPVRSQALRLEALEASGEVPLDDPWDAVWDGAPSQEVPLSVQNISPPFGGGTVSALTARALHDGDRLYLLLEWADGEVDDAVNGFEEFSDAAAVQFPSASADGLPSYTMGGPGSPVNIWQWKAVWQADIKQGFATSQTRYPDTYVDEYQNGDDPLYRTAAYVGNPLAQREHDSPVENLVAEGFGTLTHSDVQDVAGSGAWREGQWRALFARDLAPSRAQAESAGRSQHQRRLRGLGRRRRRAQRREVDRGVHRAWRRRGLSSASRRGQRWRGWLRRRAVADRCRDRPRRARSGRSHARRAATEDGGIAMAPALP